MKKILIILATLLVVSVNAQIPGFKPKTGDVEMDNMLKDIDEKGQKDIAFFNEEVATKFKLPKEKVEELSTVMPAGDVYMIAQIAEITGKPIETVKANYTKNKNRGWGEIAKQLGIKPGSKEFKALKNKTKEHGNSKGKGKSDKKGKKMKSDKKEKSEGKSDDKNKKEEKEKSEKKTKGKK